MKTISTKLLVVVSISFILAIPAVAHADRDHHRYDRSHHYDRHDYAYSQRHHYKNKKKHHKRKHGHKHSHRHNYGGYNRGYNQPPRYFDNYPQPLHNHRSSYNRVTYPAPVYGYPPNVTLGVNTGNASFMLRY